MSGLFLDSNVILYLLSSDARKADAAEGLLSQNSTISVQVLNEITSVCQRKLKMPWAETTDLLAAVKANCKVVPLTVETHAQAVRIAQQHQLSFYDAHIVATAIGCSAHTLMSEDMREGLKLQGVRIQNPFALQ
jgi:predicted nucleic acid-binding protein